MSTQEEKKALLKSAYDEKWPYFRIVGSWKILDFSSETEMILHIQGLYNDRMTDFTKQTRQLVVWEVCLHWCEYQYACIDGSLAVANQVSKDNIFRAMLCAG